MREKSLLATALLYKPLGHDSFDAVKKTFFEQQLSSYYADTPIERWRWLNNAFCDVIPQPGIQATLSNFMDTRQQADASKFVLSLEQCLDYFERFYFLYQNDDPVFRLSDRVKASFLSLMREAITNSQLCETGRFRRFEELIMEFRSDKNWIDNLLQKHRYLIINELQEAYNHKQHVLGGMHIHTLGVMQRLAQERQLGVAQLHELPDVHMSTEAEQRIKAYFDKHYAIRFEEYEQNAIKNISEYVLLKMSELLQVNKVNISQWETKGIVLPNGYKIELMPSHRKLRIDEMNRDTVYLYLQEIYLQGEQIYGVTQHGVPFPLIETSKRIEPDPNEDVQKFEIDFEEIKQILHEGKRYTLPDSFQEQLIVSLLAERGCTSYYAINNAFFRFFIDYLELSDIEKIRADFLTELNEEEWQLVPKQECLVKIQYYIEQMMLHKQYFISFASCYEDDFDIQRVPLRLKDNITIESINEISQLFIGNILNRVTLLALLNNEQTIATILNYPFILLRHLKNDFQLLSALPSRCKSDRLFMKEVMHIISLKIIPLIEANDDESIHLIMQDAFNAVGEQVDYFELWPEPLRHHELIETILTEHQQKQLKDKNDILLSLTTTPIITLYQFVQLTQQITPFELESILRNRADLPIDPLPYCHDLNLFSKFCHELSPSNNWTHYLGYKRQLIDQKSTTLAATYLIATEYWFLAYMRYQHHYSGFESRHEVEVQLRNVIRSLSPLKVLLPFFIMAVCMAFIVLVYPTIKKNEKTPAWLMLIMTLELIPSVRLIALSITIVEKWPTYDLEFTTEISHFISKLRATLTVTPDMPFAGDIITRCEDSILRLQGLDNPSAHQKAELLKCALNDVKEKSQAESLAGYQIARKLQEESCIVYKGKTHRLSFWSIAAQKRKTDTFDFTAIEDTHGIPNTSTVRHLTAEPFSQWFK